MLEIEDLWVSVDQREILKGVFLSIAPGETHILFGKNGSGKSTLLFAIMGFPHCEVRRGQIRFLGRDITHLPTYERARMGLGLAFQRPPTIRGVKIRDLLAACSHGSQTFAELCAAYHFTDFLDREVNYGFSGGELKRSELLQLLVQNPRLALLDEPESGVDLENLQVVGELIRRLLQKDRRRLHREKSGLIITHTGFILDYLSADWGYILLEGRIWCRGHPREILQDIKDYGYEECARCLR